MENRKTDEYFWRLLSKKDWSGNAVAQNLDPKAREGIRAIELRALENVAVEITIQQLGQMPANRDGHSFLRATYFDPEYMADIQKKLRDIVDWVQA